MPDYIDLPLIKSLIPPGIEFGSVLLVEFAPDSIWYEVSQTIAAQAARNNIGSEYHCLIHDPNEIREAINKHGVDAAKLERDDGLRIIDDYTAQVGLLKKPEINRETSLKVADWSILATLKLKSAGESDKRRLHIDDNTSVLSRYNKENEIVDYWRTRLIPISRTLEQVMIHSLVTGVHSEAFYNQLESWHDGIIDVKNKEREGELEHFIRVRIMRGCEYDSKWHRLQRGDNGEITMAD
jgi:KaiC/GvpD/RAD55 family RecA-like ATPase